jgi:hypothetical protein
MRATLMGPAFILIFAAASSACDFVYSPSPELYRQADTIFVGKVVESPWKRGSNGDTVLTGRSNLLVRFSVERTFRGTPGTEVRLSSRLSDCSYPFLEGETYLVHAHRRDGEWNTGSPQRPLLLSDAGEALKYIEGAVRNRPPGLLYGHARLRGRGGETSIPSAAILSVHLDGRGGHFQIRIDPLRYFEIVAPPGEYNTWLDLNGKPVSERKNVRLVEGKAVLQSLEGRLD